MTITQVLYALETARCQNVSKAAERMFVSQPALSAQLGKLEEELGCKLFRRGHQGVSLTAAGVSFCQTAEAVEAAWRELQESTRNLQNAVCRQIRIGMGPRALSNGLVDALLSFFDQHPETEVSFITDIGEDMLTALEEGRLDMAVDRLPPPSMLRHPERFYASPLLEEREYVLMSAEDPRSSCPEFRLEMLEGSAVVAGPEGSLDDLVMQENCKKHSVHPGRIYRVDNLDAVMSLVQRGKGIALGPRSFIQRRGIAAVPLLPSIDICLYLICLQQNRENHLVVRLKRYLGAYIRSAAGPLSSGRMH